MSKPSLHQHTATVVFKVGEPRDIDYDMLTPNTHGFSFLRLDGTGDYIAAELVAEIQMRTNKLAEPMGSA